MVKRSAPAIVVRVEQELKERIEIAVRLRGESLQCACYRLLCEYVEQTKQMQQEGKLNNCSDKTNNYK